MPLPNKKQKAIFRYYSENGFNHSTEEIVQELEICHKTFFNRYGSKVNSIDIAWNYWQTVCLDKWSTLMEHCNHSVEELVMTLFSIEQARNADPHFYDYTRQSRKYLEQNSFFYKALHTILEKGKQCFHIHEHLNLDIYIAFLLNNIFLIDTEQDKKPEVLRYILIPALTERGMELYHELPTP